MCLAFVEGNAVELVTAIRAAPSNGDTFDIVGRQITINGQPVQNPLLVKGTAYVGAGHVNVGINTFPAGNSSVIIQRGGDFSTQGLVGSGVKITVSPGSPSVSPGTALTEIEEGECADCAKNPPEPTLCDEGLRCANDGASCDVGLLTGQCVTIISLGTPIGSKHTCRCICQLQK
jgi:hypothetical protein